MRRIFPAASVLHRSRWMILVWHWRARRHRHFRHDRCMDQEHPLVGLVYIVWLALEPDVDDFDLGQAFGTILATASDNSTTSGADHFPFLKFLLTMSSHFSVETVVAFCARAIRCLMPPLRGMTGQNCAARAKMHAKPTWLWSDGW